VKGGVLLPRECLRCKTQNEATNKFCKLCGLPLSEETQRDLIANEYKQKEADNLMNNLLKDPEVLAILSRKLKEAVV
jgi:predicted amidophosphoribosyltransferase